MKDKITRNAQTYSWFLSIFRNNKKWGVDIERVKEKKRQAIK